MATKTTLASASLIALGPTVQTHTASAAVVQAWEFESALDGTDGWNGSPTWITNLKQDTASTGEGVLTADNILRAANPGGNQVVDPQLTIGGLNLTPSGGETWDSFIVRWRIITDDGSPNDGNPESPSTNANNNIYAGSVLIMGANLGGFSTDDTVVQADGWLVTTKDISARGSNTVTDIRYDPYGNDETIMFEIDYIRITQTPEPSSLALIGLGALTMIRRRR